MSKILIVKAVKELAKKHDKQVGSDFIELYGRKVYESLERVIISCPKKRLTSGDFIYNPQ